MVIICACSCVCEEGRKTLLSHYYLGKYSGTCTFSPFMVFSPERDTKGKNKGKCLQPGMLITPIHSFNCLWQASTMCVPGKQGGQRSLISNLLPLSSGWGTVLPLHSTSKRTTWHLLLKNVNNFSLGGPLLHLQTQLILMFLVCILMRDHRQFIEVPIIPF